MSNIPEKENPTVQNPDIAENATAQNDDFNEADFSTVFSAPAAHKRTAPKANTKRKKYIINIVAGIFVVAVLGTTLWLVRKYIPVMEGKDGNADNSSSLYDSSFHEDKNIKELNSDTLASVTITNENGTIKFYSTTKKVETESSVDGTKTEADVVTWHIDGVDDSYLSASDIASFIGQVGRISVVNEITEVADADYGLATPTAKADIVCKDGTSFTVTLGSSHMAGSYYGKLSDTGKLYLVTGGYSEELIKVSALDFSATTATPAFKAPSGADKYLTDNGTLAYFDKLTLKSANFDVPLVFGTNNDESLSNMLAYIVTSPSKRIAQNAEHIVSVFSSGIGVSGTYAFGVTDENIKKYGLDKPDLEATIEVMGKTMTYKFKLQEDGYCAVVADGSNVISKISSSINFSGDSSNPISLTDVLNYDITDYYAKWITLYNIADLANLTVTVKDQVYSFDITENPDTTSEDSYVIKLGGKQIDCQSFQYLYQLCVSLQCNDFELKELEEAPEIIFDFKFDDKKFENVVVKFTRSSASSYQYNISGIDMGQTTSSEINKFVKYLEKVAAGEIIDEIV